MVLWLAGCTPPPLALGVPAGPVSGDPVVTVESSGTVELSVDGVALGDVSPGPHTLDAGTWTDGAHTVSARAGWPWARAKASATIHVDRTGPALHLELSPPDVEQGHTLAVFVRSDEPLHEPAVTVLDRERPLRPVGDGLWRALVGVPIRADAGPTPVRVTASDGLGNVAEARTSVEVRPVAWITTGRLPLSRAKAAVEPEGKRRMREERDAVYATHTDVQRWTGPFAMPLEGTHTSAFGTYREYPDGSRSHHDAEDIGRRRGTPILAPAPGVVALARMQEVHGNAVLLDHGHGVISLYSHLQELSVTEGDAVGQGVQLGTVGSTGRSTGPHLHWGVVVDGVPVDPMEWADRDPGALPTGGGAR